MHVGANRESDRLAGADRALRQIGGEADRLPVVACANGIGKLRSCRGNSTQFKGPFTSQQNADQARPQEKTEAIGKSLDYGRDVGRPVQGLSDIGENFSAPVFFA